jgi:Zn-dependent M16 (insulinase) family peptidase
VTLKILEQSIEENLSVVYFSKKSSKSQDFKASLIVPAISGRQDEGQRCGSLRVDYK